MSELTEIVFLVEDDLDGGYTAKALGESIFTEADDLQSLKIMIRDAVNCHFENPVTRPKIVRLHIVKDEVFAL
jgi:hypothetical protein